MINKIIIIATVIYRVAVIIDNAHAMWKEKHDVKKHRFKDRDLDSTKPFKSSRYRTNRRNRF